jgi:peptide/nickel transport system substrate-binding protein
LNELKAHLVEEVRAGTLTRRQLIQRASVAGLALPTIGTLLAACGSSGSSTTLNKSNATAGPIRRGGTGVLGTIAPTGDIDPITAYDDGSNFTDQIALEFLCMPSADLGLYPVLASSWSADSGQKEWTFNLRKGVKWQDGSDFTAADVVATFNTILNPKVGAAGASAFTGILNPGNVEKRDPHTVVFHLTRPYVSFPTLVSGFNFGALILPKNYQPGEFVKGGIGTGPFILTKYTTEQGAAFKRNPNYWRPGRPYLDAIQMKYYNDSSTMVLGLQGGAFDVFLRTPFQGIQALLNNKNVRIRETHSSQYRQLHMRVDRAPFTDERVRQAVAYCLDRPTLLSTLLGGHAQIGNDNAFAPVFTDSTLVTRDLPQRKQDYAKAKALLAAAGHTNGIDVTLTTEQFQEIPEYASEVKEMCAPAGIRINLDIESQTAYYGSGNNEPFLDVPMGIVDWAGRGAPAQVIDPSFVSNATESSSHWNDVQFSSIIHRYEGEQDEQKRRELALQAARIQQTATPAVISYWIDELRAIRSNVQGLAEGPSDVIDVSGMWLSHS